MIFLLIFAALFLTVDAVIVAHVLRSARERAAFDALLAPYTVNAPFAVR